MAKVHVLVVLIVCTLWVGALGQNCVGTSGGKYFDLRELESKDFIATNNVHAYYLNPCRPLLSVPNTGCTANASYICQTSKDNPSLYGYDVATDYKAMTYNASTALLTVVLADGTTCADGSHRRATIEFRCSATIGNPRFVKEDANCTYFFQWDSGAACPRMPAEEDPISRQALMDIYSSLGGSSWLRSDYWNSEASYCTWYGIKCEGSSVVALELPNNNLVGALPVAISKLTTLRVLSLYRNKITGFGALQSSLSALTQLSELILSSNEMAGELPRDIGTALPALQKLWLSNNRFTGTLPASLGSLMMLEELYVNNNQFSGAVPAELQSLTDLSELDASYNYLTSIPTQLQYLMEELDYCNLSVNSFMCPVPNFASIYCKATC